MKSFFAARSKGRQLAALCLGGLLALSIGLAGCGGGSGGSSQSNAAFTSKFVTANGVKLNYLDYGGRGEPLVLLTGINDNAHIYDDFAPRFTDRYHVYSVTRRGFGKSQQTASGYDIDTLTEDLRGLLDGIGLTGKVNLVGHSIARLELTHFAAKYPARVNSLVYLDSAYDNTSPETSNLINALDALYANRSDEVFTALSWPTPTAPDRVSVEKIITFYQRILPDLYGKTSTTLLLNYVPDFLKVRPDHTLVLDSDEIETLVTPNAIPIAIGDATNNYHAAEDWARIKCPVLVLAPDYTNAALDYPYLFNPNLYLPTPAEQRRATSLHTGRSNRPVEAPVSFLSPLRPHSTRVSMGTTRVANPIAAVTATPTPSPIPSAAVIAEAIQIAAQEGQIYATWAQQSATHFKQVAPQTTIVTIPNTTHYLFIQQPAATAQAMRTFLSAYDGV